MENVNNKDLNKNLQKPKKQPVQPVTTTVPATDPVTEYGQKVKIDIGQKSYHGSIDFPSAKDAPDLDTPMPATITRD